MECYRIMVPGSHLLSRKYTTSHMDALIIHWGQENQRDDGKSISHDIKNFQLLHIYLLGISTICRFAEIPPFFVRNPYHPSQCIFLIKGKQRPDDTPRGICAVQIHFLTLESSIDASYLSFTSISQPRGITNGGSAEELVLSPFQIHSGFDTIFMWIKRAAADLCRSINAFGQVKNVNRVWICGERWPKARRYRKATFMRTAVTAAVHTGLTNTIFVQNSNFKA